MRIKCIKTTGNSLLGYKRTPLGLSEMTQYGELEVNEEYTVMGMIMNHNGLSYLISSGRVVSFCPYQLFEILDNRIDKNWYFKPFFKEDDNYINIEAVWGYYELCFDDQHYFNLIDMEPESHKIFFKRKDEMERSI